MTQKFNQNNHKYNPKIPPTLSHHNSPFLAEPTYLLKNDELCSFSSVTNLCWKPYLPGQNMMNILISTHSNGELLFWHATSCKFYLILEKIVKRVREVDNVIFCLDYNQTGQFFATGGQDSHVNITNIL